MTAVIVPALAATAAALLAWILVQILLPHNGAHRIPAHPVYGPLRETPAAGIRVFRADGVITCGGRNLGTRPRIGNAEHPPWHTAPLPRLPLEAETATPRYPCCVHCTDGAPCDPADSHLTPCLDGCNEPLDDEEATELARAACVRRQLPACDGPDPETLRAVLDGLRRLPVYNQKSQLAVEEAQRLAKAMIA